LADQKLVDNPAGGNARRAISASYPIDQQAVEGSHPLFTAFNFLALGVPRNPELKVNATPQYFDMGACELSDRSIVPHDAQRRLRSQAEVV
jgi:cytochrome c peroxidase